MEYILAKDRPKTKYKECPSCERLLPLEEFQKDQSWCQPCQNDRTVKCICGCGKHRVWQNMMYWVYPDESPELPGCYAVDQEHFDKAFDICR